MPFISFKNVIKEYPTGDKKFRAVDAINFEIERGEFVVILGPSGAGKSTVLNLLGGMDHATEGAILIDGKNITKYNEHALTAYRRDVIGFVFQFYNLIPTLTALENVALTGEVKKDAFDPKETLSLVGLEEHIHQFPAQLSGGEQQRVSIARAICKNPKLLLCDEPTGALDSETGVIILTLLRKIGKEKGHTVVVVTHNAALAPTADRVIKMRSGKISSQQINVTPVSMEEVNW